MITYEVTFRTKVTPEEAEDIESYDPGLEHELLPELVEGIIEFNSVVIRRIREES